MVANQSQVQRAGGEGFAHNEVNPDANENRLLQLWALPETAGAPAEYKFYDFKDNELIRIYGGKQSQSDTFDSHTIIETGLLNIGKRVTKKGEFLDYIANGEALLNDVLVQDGDLIRGDNLNLVVTSKTLQLTLIGKGDQPF